MSRIQELLRDKTGRLDFNALLEAQPWVLRRGMQCVLSPDSDGLLCGLFMSTYFGWRVVGFYDGKVLVIADGLSCFDPEVAFFDMEVYRRGVRSMGHHMLAYRTSRAPIEWAENFGECINPHLVRGYDAREFRLKYPLANIHLLIALVSSRQRVEIRPSAIPPLLFTDGTFNVLFKYPENVLNWLSYLGIGDAESPLRRIFMQEDLTVYGLMLAMDEFFRKRDDISIKNERGDRLRISTTDGEPVNLEEVTPGIFRLEGSAKSRLEQFLVLLSRATGWPFDPGSWQFTDWRVHQFTKSDFTSKGWNLTIPNFQRLLAARPLSWAMTSGVNIEFTLEDPGRLP